MFWNSSVSGEDAWTFQFLKKDLELISSWKKTMFWNSYFPEKVSETPQFLEKVPELPVPEKGSKWFQKSSGTENVPELFSSWKGFLSVAGGVGGSELLHSWKSSRTTWFLKNKQTDNQLRNSYIPEKGSGTLQFLKRLLGLFSSWKMFCNSYIPEKASRTLQLLEKKKRKRKAQVQYSVLKRVVKRFPFPEKSSRTLWFLKRVLEVWTLVEVCLLTFIYLF